MSRAPLVAVLDRDPGPVDVRIPLPPDGPHGGCYHDSGPAVAIIWCADGRIRAVCGDHDEPGLPELVRRPWWWRGPWVDEARRTWWDDLRAWLQCFPRP